MTAIRIPALPNESEETEKSRTSPFGRNGKNGQLMTVRELTIMSNISNQGQLRKRSVSKLETARLVEAREMSPLIVI